MFTQHCTHKKNIVYERYRFLTHKHKEEQTVDSFVTELKLKAMSFKYEDLEESYYKRSVGIECKRSRITGKITKYSGSEAY